MGSNACFKQAQCGMIVNRERYALPAGEWNGRWDCRGTCA